MAEKTGRLEEGKRKWRVEGGRRGRRQNLFCGRRFLPGIAGAAGRGRFPRPEERTAAAAAAAEAAAFS